jgi:hypothetical protein
MSHRCSRLSPQARSTERTLYLTFDDQTLSGAVSSHRFEQN